MWFATKIEDWYLDNQRDLPWRKTTDAYKIWLSEIILQQTRIEQGLSYYHRFVEKYPTVGDLARASEEDVLKCWQGLGYYSRARNLHAAAQYIVNDLKGEFPKTYDGLINLKGVGRYTAAAIASFAYRLPYPVIDGNVYRLISRVFGIYTPIATDTAYKEYETLLLKLIDKTRPDLFNQAIMDFGSTYCKPTGCDCEGCIFKSRCVAYQEGKVDSLPVKQPKIKPQERFFYYVEVCWGDNVLLHQRTQKDIWKGLYEFPLIESGSMLSDAEVERMVLQLYGDNCRIEKRSTAIHKLTHRTIVATFYRAIFHQKPVYNEEKEQVFSREEIKKLPVSRLIDRYLNEK